MAQTTMSGDARDALDGGRRMQRIRRLSRVMSAGCVGISVLLAVAMALYWTTTPARTLIGHAGLPDAQATEITTSVRLLAFGISMVPMGTFIAGLLAARRCFATFAMGRIFTIEAIGTLRVFAIAIAVSAVLKPFAGVALSVLLSFSVAAGSRAMVLNIGSDEIIALIFAGTMTIIAWVMAEALQIADENKQFV